MDAGDALAIYAAVVATAALGWNVYSFRRARANIVTVHPRFSYLGKTEVIAINVVNRSDRSGRVTSAWVESQAPGLPTVYVDERPPDATLPGVIAVNDSGLTYIPAAETDAMGINLADPVVACVQLATEERPICSNPEPLL